MSTGAAFESDPLGHAAREALSCYLSPLERCPLLPLGNHGGFSGARLWRVEGTLIPLCLRAWPPGETSARLAVLHRLMTTARVRGLAFVPMLLTTPNGATAVAHAGRLWELSEWLPGRADFHEHPTAARLEAACRSLAALHLTWEKTAAPALCPAVRRRLDHLAEWHALVRSGWHPVAALAPDDPTRPMAERAWSLLRHRLDLVPRRLERWTTKQWPLQPCLCDVWHDHLLFEGDRLTGLVDYGAVKSDHVAVDLARLLGSLIGDEVRSWQRGLTAYRAVRPLSASEEELARDLDVTGVVLGVATWLRWLGAERRAFEDRTAAARRLGVLVERIERWR